MKKEKKPSEIVASRIKLQKVAVAAAFALAVILTLLFLGDSHYYDGIETRGIGLGLHPIAIVAVIVAECIAAVILYSRAESRVEKILDDKCDPKLYYDVKRALFSRGAYMRGKNIVDLNVSYYLGDIASCRRFADEAIRAVGDPDKLYGYAFLGLSAFFLRDKKMLSEAAQKSRRLLDRANIPARTPLYADLDRRLRLLETLLASMEERTDEAIRFADALESLPTRTTTLERFNTLFLRGLVYESAGEKKKALACFEGCISGTEKTFICEEAKKHI